LEKGGDFILVPSYLRMKLPIKLGRCALLLWVLVLFHVVLSVEHWSFFYMADSGMRRFDSRSPIWPVILESKEKKTIEKSRSFCLFCSKKKGI